MQAKLCAGPEAAGCARPMWTSMDISKVSPAVLAREMEKGIRSPEYLHGLGEAGRRAWQDRFTWAKIAQSYERILRGET